ncbi:MAG TPA: sulfotransferase [Rudaea sp.]|nr:sulfotransferase [Rudaea sp.]
MAPNPKLKLRDAADLPGPARAALAGALRALERGDLADAERRVTAALAHAPRHAEPHRLLGIVLQRLGRPAHAAASFREALAAKAGDADLLERLAHALAEADDLAAAIATARELLACDETSQAAYLLASLLERHGEIEAAAVVLERLLTRDPSRAPARAAYARGLFQRGRSAEAESEYRRLLKAGKEVANAWHGLAEMKTVRFDASDRAALERLCAGSTLGDLERASVLHALGKAHEDVGDYAAAFAALERAAHIERAKFPWNAKAFADYVAGLRDAFARPVPNAADDFGSEAIFIVGMPRSGSTLVEQVLAAHSDVEGASELPDLQRVIRRESERRRAPLAGWAGQCGPADWRRLGEEYLASTRRWRERKPRFTDKMPGNWMYVEAALAMLPGARVIDCRRDPLETCWSCFKQFFAPGLAAWSRSFADLAAYWHACRDHLDRLAARYPAQVRVQSYEALVESPQPEIERLLAFCGLAFDPACLRPQDAQRTVRTASAAQVRTPLARRASNASLYAEWLGPLRDALAIERP